MIKAGGSRKMEFIVFTNHAFMVINQIQNKGYDR